MYLKLLALVVVFLFFSLTSQAFAQNEDKIVVFHTDAGELVIEFFPMDAPKTVENFLSLTESGLYDQTIFHRVIKDFMIQGGDPKTKPGGYEKTSDWGTGDPGYKIKAEFNNIKHNRGIVSMARMGNDPDSAGSQFFIVHNGSNTPHLDGQYTVFGRLVTQESYETLDEIASLPTVLDIPENWGHTEINKSEVLSRSDRTDLLELGAPERTTISTIGPDTQYTDEKLGISFKFPQGWIPQNPTKSSSDVPDFVAVGPKTGAINAFISILIKNSDGKSLDEKISEIKDKLQDSIDQGQLEILYEEKTKLDGKDAYIMESSGIFISQTEVSDIKFKEVTIASSDKFYTLTYGNNKENFERDLHHFEKTLNSFAISSEEDGSNDDDNSSSTGDVGGTGGCLIATATYGTELAPQVQQLRELRDNIALKTKSGSMFLQGFNQLYYSFSPTVADWERENPIFKDLVKLTITPLLYSTSLLNYVDIDSESEMLVYGLSIMLLNIGMYFVVPAIAIHKLRK